jgi:hypothetical protein
MKNSIPLFWLLVWVPVHSCINKTYLNEIKSYLNAATITEKSKYMAEDYHSFFIRKNQNGKNKSQALQSFQNWDAPLHPDIKILSYSFHDSVWTVEFNEQNDFSKPIGFPGWKGTATFVFNSKDLIQETMYVPDSTNLSYKPFLQPALDWLQLNRPAELNEVYQNGKLVQTEASANKWRLLLREWQAQKNNSR